MSCILTLTCSECKICFCTVYTNSMCYQLYSRKEEKREERKKERGEQRKEGGLYNFLFYHNIMIFLLLLAINVDQYP